MGDHSFLTIARMDIILSHSCAIYARVTSGCFDSRPDFSSLALIPVQNRLRAAAPLASPTRTELLKDERQLTGCGRT